MEKSLINQSNSDTDNVLARQAKAGDSSAFTRLLERYMPMIKSRANRYAGVVGQDVEDFVQEAMLALFKAARGYDEQSGNKFKTYAVTCINNSLASAIKKHMKDRAAQLPLKGGEEQDAGAYEALKPPMQPEDIFIEQEDSAQLISQIQSMLSDFERQVLRLYLRGNSYAEISDATGAAQKAVDNALQRVRRKLRPGL